MKAQQSGVRATRRFQGEGGNYGTFLRVKSKEKGRRQTTYTSSLGILYR